MWRPPISWRSPRSTGIFSSDISAHDPEKHALDPDRGWEPVFGKDHAAEIALRLGWRPGTAPSVERPRLTPRPLTFWVDLPLPCKSSRAILLESGIIILASHVLQL